MAQESGNVTELREAYTRLATASGVSIECLIDTGFTGALVLPAEFVARIESIDVGRELFNLVGGTQMEADIALVSVEWLGAERTLRAIVSENDDALIGTELLDGTVLTIDYVARTDNISKPE